MFWFAKNHIILFSGTSEQWSILWAPVDKGEKGELSNTSVGLAYCKYFAVICACVFHPLLCTRSSYPSYFSSRLYLILLSYRLQLVLISFSLESFFIIPLSISPTSASRGYIYQNWVLFSLLSCHALLVWSRYSNTSTILRESLDGDERHRGFVQVHFSQYGEPTR